MKNKKAISLIVLVITIIVIIILASAIILSLNNNRIIDKAKEAVEKTNEAQVNQIAQLAWAEAYADGVRTVEDVDDKKGFNTRVEEALAANGITGAEREKYEVTVTEKGVTVALKTETGDVEQGVQIPETWQTNVTAIVDTVPIPKGFVASPYAGENTKDGGLVIYELNAGETAIPNTETQQTSWTTRNQYVWIPVDKDTFNTTFVRNSFEMSSITLSDTLGTSYWEVLPTTEETENNLKYMVQTTTLAEVQAMYESVEEYGGFYIARYEAGIDAQRTEKGTDGTSLPRTTSNVHSKMGKIPYTYIPWTWNEAMNEEANGAVEVARGLYPNSTSNKTGVISTLTYGVQWDSAVAWLQTNGKDINGNAIASVTDSIEYGNYKNHTIEEGDLNADAQYWDHTASSSGSYKPVTYSEGVSTPTKDNKTNWALSTGALKVAKVNNIYDMAGNMREWTMEGYSTLIRVIRGGGFASSGARIPVAYRDHCGPNVASYSNGFRPSLYIKTII